MALHSRASVERYWSVQGSRAEAALAARGIADTTKRLGSHDAGAAFPKRPRGGLRLRYLGPLIVLVVIGMLIAASYPGYRTAMHDMRAEVLAGSRVIETAAGPIEYADAGTGAPVLVLHGNGGGYDQGLLAGRMFIGEGFRLIVPSRFGYLHTPLPEDGSAAAQADAYAALLDALDIGQVVVAAISDGGPSALQFALRHPDRIAGLIMVAAKSHTPPPDNAVQSFAFSTLFRSDYLYWAVTNLFESQLLALLGMPSDVQQALAPEQVDAVTEYLRIMHPISMRAPGIYNDREALSALPSQTYPLERITAPTLVIHGTLDSLQPFTHAQHTAGSIPGTRLVELEGGGHVPVDHLEQITTEVHSFLADHTAVP
jgi:2-hydroxy-6-oxonona-2,4-dienedioate hydrolase